MKSSIPLTAACAVMVLAFTGCSASDSGASTTELEFQTAASADSPLFAELENVAAEFVEEHPEIEVDVVPQTNSYEADMKVRLASGDVPDIIGTHGWSRDRYSEFLEPLQDEEWAADVNPALDGAMRGDGGEIYALPLNVDVVGIATNFDVLDAAGIDPEDLTTWDALTEAGEKLAADGIRPFVVGGKDGFAGGVADNMAPSFHAEGDLEKLLDGTFTAEPYTAMLQQVDEWREAGLINQDYSSATGDDMARAMADGQAAFIFGGNGRIAAALAYNPDAKIGFIPVPALDEGGAPYLISGENVAFGVARDGENLDEATKFLDFLADPDRVSTIAAASGNAPGLTTAELGLKGAIADSYQKYVVEEEVAVVPFFDRVYLPNGMWDTMTATADGVLNGQLNPEAASEQMAADFKSLYGQSN